MMKVSWIKEEKKIQHRENKRARIRETDIQTTKIVYIICTQAHTHIMQHRQVIRQVL